MKEFFNGLLKKLFVAGLCLGTGSVTAQTHCYVQTDLVKVSGVTSAAAVSSLPQGSKSTMVSYFDGLGRPIQSVAVQASPLGHDIVQPAAYNTLGQQTKGYLPYATASTDGSFHANAITSTGMPEQAAYYNNGTGDKVADDNAPYSQQVFENSPLLRLLKAGQVGSIYQPTGTHYKSANYRANTAADNVELWLPGSISAGSYYSAGHLSVADGTDEQGGETLVFTDMAGRTILKRQINSGSNVDTYYLYNIAGMPAYVVPPKAVVLMQAAGNYNLGVAGVDALLFKYQYDGIGRLYSKTVPGAGAMSIIYDPLMRPVLLQDANLAAANQWNYIKYDAAGRAVSQGIYLDNGNIGQGAMQGYVDGLVAAYGTVWFEARQATGPDYYTNNVFPTTGTTPLAFSYYDDYDLNQDGTDDFGYVNSEIAGMPSTSLTATHGMPTVVRKRTVGPGLGSIWLTSVTYYDDKGQAIQTLGNNQLHSAMADKSSQLLDFTGKPTSTKAVKTVSSATTVVTAYSYDAQGRVTSIDQKYNNSPNTIRVAAYEYNEMGQLVKKNLHSLSGGSTPAANVPLGAGQAISGTGQNLTVVAGQSITLGIGFSVTNGATFSGSIAPTAYLQSLDYRYNIRGQLLTINNSTLSNDGGVTNGDTNDLFGMELLYDQADGNIGNTAYYNGQISAVKWMTGNGTGTNTHERSYKYTYDPLNRLTAANYAERSGTGSFGGNVGGFDETMDYDEQGNIRHLHRYASAPGGSAINYIDNLTYSYASGNANQLAGVSDAAINDVTGGTPGFNNITGSTGSYTYDANGNMLADPFKGLSTDYNVLNKANTMTITTATGRYLAYSYDAGGTLLEKQVYDGGALKSTTDYIGGFVYTNGTLDYFAMPEGRVLYNGGAFTSEYVVTDNQGNARISFQDNGSGTAVVKQENSYYAFGMAMPNGPVPLPSNPNKNLYNGGAEWQNDFGNLPDLQQTFFRNYDAALGRWTGIDPMAESAESMTTYQYAGNNPVMMNDPMGNKAAEPGSDAAIAAMIPGNQTYGVDDLYNPYLTSGGGSSFSNETYIANVGFVATSDLRNIYTADDPASKSYNQFLGYLANQGFTFTADNSSNSTGGVGYFFGLDGKWTTTGSNGTDQNTFNILENGPDQYGTGQYHYVTANSGGVSDTFMNFSLNGTGNLLGLKAGLVTSFLDAGFYKNAAGQMVSYENLAKFKVGVPLSEQGNLSKAFTSYRSAGTTLTWGSRAFSGAAMAWDVSQGKPREVIIGDGAMAGMAEIPFIGPPTALFLWLNSFIPASPSSNFANPGRQPGHYAEWLR